MPITFSIDPAKRTVFTTMTGPLLDGDPTQYLADVLAHPSYQPGLAALVHCRDIELGRISSSAVRRAVDFSKSAEHELRDTRVAIVAKQPAVYGIARMYQLLRDPPYELRVFRETSEAESWLACRPLDPPPGR